MMTPATRTARLMPPGPASGFTRPSGYGRPPSGTLGWPSLVLTGEVTDSRWETPPWTDAEDELILPEPPSELGPFARHIWLLQQFGAVRIWPMNEPVGSTQSNDLAGGGHPWKARSQETFWFGAPGPYPDATALAMIDAITSVPPTETPPPTYLWPNAPMTITGWMFRLGPPIAGGVIPPPPPPPIDPPVIVPPSPTSTPQGGITMPTGSGPTNRLTVSADTITAAYNSQQLQAPVTSGVWTLWVMTVNEAGKLSLYENGSLVASQTFPVQSYQVLDPPAPNASHRTVYGPWSIIPRALTAPEVAALVQGDFAPPPEPSGQATTFAEHIGRLLSYGAKRIWPMNNPAGSTYSYSITGGSTFGGGMWFTTSDKTFGAPGPYPDATACNVTTVAGIPPPQAPVYEDQNIFSCPVTVTAWVRSQSSASPAAQGGVDLSRGSVMSGLQIAGDQVRAVLNDQSVSAANVFDTWTLWTAVNDSDGSVRLYRDRVQVAEGQFTPNPQNLNKITARGSYNIGYGPQSVIDRALTPEEIARL